MFKAQAENFCKCHCNAPVLIFFDCGIMQRFVLSDKVPFLFWRKHAVLIVEISPLFLWESQNKDRGISLWSFSLSQFTPSYGHCHRLHQWGCPWLKWCAVQHSFSYILEEAFHLLFLTLSPTVGLVLCPVLPSLFWKVAVHGYATALFHLQV